MAEHRFLLHFYFHQCQVFLPQHPTSKCYPGVINVSNSVVHNFNTRRSIFFYFIYFVLHIFPIIWNEFREKLTVRIFLIYFIMQRVTRFLPNMNWQCASAHVRFLFIKVKLIWNQYYFVFWYKYRHDAMWMERKHHQLYVILLAYG